MSSSTPLFPFGKLATASYFICLFYFLLFLQACSKFRQIASVARSWVPLKQFHLGLVILTTVRTTAFVVLSFFSWQQIEDSDSYCTFASGLWSPSA